MVVRWCGLWATSGCSGAIYGKLMQDELQAADLFSEEPELMSASFGFDGILGVDGGEEEVRAAGGAWNQLACEPPDRRVETSSATTSALARSFGADPEGADGLPVVFSWPVLPSTVQPEDFEVVLSDGSPGRVDGVSLVPNQEYNERQVIVLVGEFGDREGQYAERVTVVEDDSPLQLVGPDGPVSAVGLTFEGVDPYETGPSLVAAKLTAMSTDGEGSPQLFSLVEHNDGVTLYGERARWRLRLYTSGGFSPDGVRGLRPDEFSSFFLLHAQAEDGSAVELREVGVDYAIGDGQVRVLGLADLGEPASDEVAYDDCYLEDWDNYIDIVMDGDRQAIERLVSVEIPAAAPYQPFYNPGGPGNDPTPGVRYTAAGPPDLQPIWQALDDPRVVSWP
jgi:hypothetical protein